FTLGDRPETRWRVAAEWLADHEYDSTLDYVRHMGELVLHETGLLPHFNPGVMTWAEMQRLRPLSPSMGMMLETTSKPLWETPGQPHFAWPDKDPALRLQVLEDAGRSRIPFTTGILLGIGETVQERVESIIAIRDVHQKWGHIQETIVQNFRAKPRTAMQNSPDFAHHDYIIGVAVARLVMGPAAHIQAPPNLTQPDELHSLIRAGIDDWGGISPLTPDHVNPERPWPQIERLAELTAQAGYLLEGRLTVHPRWAAEPDYWLGSDLHGPVRQLEKPRRPRR
ncbi:MAG TPA: 7,8-didemethyl-8-hydroxy-5-deazariboflavin synthase CofG, partial [Beutenbergiaceae bacterium]|nr:7,8-didemethyl-8-hydroxy-5-deazariboflavin synthase CofG [Beutenbergiaceae bacterium]